LLEVNNFSHAPRDSLDTNLNFTLHVMDETYTKVLLVWVEN
jgi:hypothetical protein